jgi:hypothetical protein
LTLKVVLEVYPYHSLKMASLEGLQIRVSLVVNGSVLTEYDDTEDNYNRRYITDATLVQAKYVECQDDQEFSIRCEVIADDRWASQEPSFGIKFKVYIDGKCASMCFARPVESARSHWRHDMRGVRTRSVNDEGMEVMSRFKFTAVTLGRGISRGGCTSDASNLLTSFIVEDPDPSRIGHDMRQANRLGSIQVLVYRAGRLTPLSGASNRKRLQGDLSVSEKAVKGKALSHGTS